MVIAGELNYVKFIKKMIDFMADKYYNIIKNLFWGLFCDFFVWHFWGKCLTKSSF